MIRQLILGSALLAAASFAQSGFVSYDGENLTVDFRNAPLREALEQISAETEVTFQIDPEVTGSVSGRFQDLPLDRALGRLLRTFSHILLYETTDGVDRVARVVILAEGSQQTVFPEPVVQPDPVADENPLADEDPIGDAMESGEELQGEQSNFLQPGAFYGGTGARAASSREVRLQREASGHYVHRGRINGRPVVFLIDTGATAVALPAQLAGELGVVAGASRNVFTAAGRTLGYEAQLGTVEIGPLQLQDVDAIVLPGLDAGGQVLLGMSFLAQFELVQREDTLVIRELR